MNSLARKISLASLLVVAAGVFVYLSQEEPAFPALQGPAAATQLLTAGTLLSADQYSEGGDNALAIWLKDSSSSWIGLAHGLKSMGVPFRIVTSVEEALRHDVILVYPSLTGGDTPPAALRALSTHVRTGGTLLAFSVIGGGMQEIFGFSASEERASEVSLSFDDGPFNQRYIGTSETATLNLAGADGQGMPVVAYTGLKHPPVAVFNDGSAAITWNAFSGETGTGHAYAIALDFGHFIRRAFNGRFSGQSDRYVNNYLPGVDLLLRFIQAAYQQGEPDAITVSPSPFGREVTILVTHDVDFTRSIENIPDYLALEKELGIPATYFIQAKYVTDYYDKRFLDPSRRDILRRLAESGMEVASHSIAHSNEFRAMPMGTGTEMYPAYQPFVKSFDEVRGATILGELRVSAFLLEHLSGSDVVSFRPGHLSLPEALPEALASTGYLNSSSITANEALTHLPYQAMFSRGYSQSLDVFEFPVTFEDEKWELAENLERVSAATEQIAAYRGLVNLLVHTEELGAKLEFLRQYVNRFRERAWFSTMGDYAAWWRARDSLRIMVRAEGNSRLVTLKSDRAVAGITLTVPRTWQLSGGPPGSSQSLRDVVVGHFDERAELAFQIDSRTTPE